MGAMTVTKLRERVQQLYREVPDEDERRDPLALLAATSRIANTVEQYRLSIIDDARAGGDSWEEIGTALGITGQAAGRWFRYHGGQDRHPSKRAKRHAQRS